MRKLCITALAFGVVMAGCQEEKKPTAAETAPPEKTPVASNNETKPAPAKPGPDPNSPGAFAEKTVDALKKATSDMRPAPKGSGNWKAVKQTRAEQIAATAEATVASAKNQLGESTSLVNIEGSPGSSIGKFSIESGSRFYIEYPKVQVEPKPNMEKEVLVSNGKVIATHGLSSKGWYGEKPLAAFRNEGNTGVEAWSTKFPRALFTALQGGKPISNLLRDAKKEGLDISLEEQPITRAGKKSSQFRILITRNKQQALKNGVLEYEIVIDGQYKLPVTFKTYLQKPLREPVKVLWTAKWSPPNMKIDPKAFEIPKVVKAPSRSTKV